jgi:hypothetical protein
LPVIPIGLGLPLFREALASSADQSIPSDLRSQFL